MARPHSLDEDPSLSRSRFGHTPALWLLLPLLIGCAIDTAFQPDIKTFLIGTTIVLGGLWLCIKNEHSSLLLIFIAGIFLGAAWHQAKLFPQTKINPTRNYAELSVALSRSSSQQKESSWSGVGMVTDKGIFFRRRIALSGKGPAPIAGGEYKISGWMSTIPDRPAGFDAWIASQGCTLKLSNGKILGVLEPPGAFSEWCQRTQSRLETWLRTLPWDDHDGGSLLAATLLGRTALLPPDAKLNFAGTGTLHLFAISGLHIAGMAAALLWLTKKFRLPEKPLGVFILILLWLYVQVTGASPSSLRAWIMAVFIWAGQISERRTPILQSLALAGAVTLILQPEASNDPGFQLSYLAVLGIICAGAPAAEILTSPDLIERMTPKKSITLVKRWSIKIKNLLISGVCISTAATIAGTPLTLIYFQSASWAGMFANLILVPLSEIPLVLGMASLSLYCWDGFLPAAKWINGLAALTLDAMAWLVKLFTVIPHLVFQTNSGAERSGQICVAFLVGCFLYQTESKSVIKLLGIPALIVLLWILFFVI